MQQHVSEVFTLLKGRRFELQQEKTLQRQMWDLFQKTDLGYAIYWNYYLDESNNIDFFFEVCDKSGFGIEVKINKGSKKSIYRQCERYCQFDVIKALILVTNRSIGFPKEILNKPCYIFNVGMAWL